MDKKYSIEFTKEELIVLSDLLFKINDSKVLEDFFEDQAEQRVMWNLEALLERKNSIIFSSNYSNELMTAKNFLRDKE